MGKYLIVYGMGGHALSCQEVFKEFGEMELIFLGPNMTFSKEGNCFIAVGDNHIRHRIFEENQNRKYLSFFSKNAFGFPASMGKGTIIMPGAIIRSGVNIGDFVIVNSGAILDHGCQVHSFAHIAPGAILLGDVTVGQGAFVGSNATVREGKKVGTWQFIKAGMVVKEDLGDQDIGSRNQDQI